MLRNFYKLYIKINLTEVTSRYMHNFSLTNSFFLLYTVVFYISDCSCVGQRWKCADHLNYWNLGKLSIKTWSLWSEIFSLVQEGCSNRHTYIAVKTIMWGYLTSQQTNWQCLLSSVFEFVYMYRKQGAQVAIFPLFNRGVQIFGMSS